MTTQKQTRKRSRKSSPKQLNLGSGEYPLDGWESADIKGGEHTVDLSSFPWPFRASWYDEIMASHVLEHFTRDDGVRFLEECKRILKKGAVLHLAVPDLDLFIGCKLSGDWSPVGGYHWKNIEWCMGGDEGETDITMRHHYMYCWQSLARTLEGLGFEVTRRDMGEHDNPRYELISLYVDAVKA